MAAKAGERESGDLRCSQCHHQVHVTKGERIPKWPNCGNETFDTRYHEPGRES